MLFLLTVCISRLRTFAGRELVRDAVNAVLHLHQQLMSSGRALQTLMKVFVIVPDAFTRCVCFVYN